MDPGLAAALTTLVLALGEWVRRSRETRRRRTGRLRTRHGDRNGDEGNVKDL